MPSRVQLFQIPDYPVLAFTFEIVSRTPCTSAGIGTHAGHVNRWTSSNLISIYHLWGESSLSMRSLDLHTGNLICWAGWPQPAEANGMVAPSISLGQKQLLHNSEPSEKYTVAGSVMVRFDS